MKFFVLIFVMFYSFSLNAQHSNLESKKIIIDDEASEIIYEYHNPEIDINSIAIVSTSSNNQKKESSDWENKVKEIKKNIKSNCRLIEVDGGRIFFMTNSNRIFEITVVRNNNEINIVSYNVNKVITNNDELILASGCYSRAYVRNIAKRTWEFNMGNYAYDTTEYSQFRFSNIKGSSFENVSDVIEYIEE